jgi:hypothetical protein
MKEVKPIVSILDAVRPDKKGRDASLANFI